MCVGNRYHGRTGIIVYGVMSPADGKDDAPGRYGESALGWCSGRLVFRVFRFVSAGLCICFALHRGWRQYSSLRVTAWRYCPPQGQTKYYAIVARLGTLSDQRRVSGTTWTGHPWSIIILGDTPRSIHRALDGSGEDSLHAP